MKTVYDLYVDGKLLKTVTAAESVYDRKRLSRLKGVEFRQRFEPEPKPRTTNHSGGLVNA